jgi:hypothetical protein
MILLLSAENSPPRVVAQFSGAQSVLPECDAFRHGESRWPVEDKQIGLFQAAMPATVANVLGLPSVTIPMAFSMAGVIE